MCHRVATADTPCWWGWLLICRLGRWWMDILSRVTAALLPPVLDIATSVVHEDGYQCHTWNDAKEYHIQCCHYVMVCIGVRSWATVLAATCTRVVTERRSIAHKAVAMPSAVAHAIPIAVLWTYRSTSLLSQGAHNHTLLIHAHLPFATLGPIWRESWIHLVKSQIHNGSPAWDDAAPRVDK